MHIPASAIHMYSVSVVTDRAGSELLSLPPTPILQPRLPESPDLSGLSFAAALQSRGKHSLIGN